MICWTGVFPAVSKMWKEETPGILFIFTFSRRFSKGIPNVAPFHRAARVQAF